jgi:hypothetical protein
VAEDEIEEEEEREEEGGSRHFKLVQSHLASRGQERP